MTLHKDLPVGEEASHPPGYVQAGDPGTVGAYRPWVDTSGGAGFWTYKIRNAANAAWELVASAGAVAWSAITGKPTTIGGYGITDAYTNTATDTLLAGKSNTGHTHAAADIASGTVATARLGTGTADATTFLRGDQTWAAPAGGGGSSTSADYFLTTGLRPY